MLIVRGPGQWLDPWPHAYTAVGFRRDTDLGYQLEDFHSYTPVFIVDTIHTRIALKYIRVDTTMGDRSATLNRGFTRRGLCPFHMLTRLAYWTVPWWGSLNARLGNGVRSWLWYGVWCLHHSIPTLLVRVPCRVGPVDEFWEVNSACGVWPYPCISTGHSLVSLLLHLS